MTNRDFDRAIQAIARRQHGTFRHAQIEQAGGTATMVRDRVRSERWYRLAPGVFALAGFPPTWQRQYKAAELTVEAAGLWRRSAALVHGLEGARVARPELVVPYTTSARSSIATVHRSAGLPLVTVDGFRATTVAQTLFDLLGVWRLDEVERAMDGAILGKRVSVAELDARRRDLDGSRRPNLPTFRALVDERLEEGWAPPESELERVAWPILQALPGAGFVRQAPASWWAAGAGRVDAMSANWALFVEIDGRRWHARVADFDRDRWRDAVAVARGYRVMRFTYAHLRERPQEVRDLLLEAGAWRIAAAG